MARDGGHSGAADYYDVLGVPRTATADEIIRAYRRLAREHHPDSNPASGSKRFQEITDAYDVIGDSERRRRYDAERKGGVGGGIRIPVNQGPGGTARTVTPRPGPARGGAATATPTPPDRPVVRVTFQEAVTGTIAAIELPEERPCGQCGGSGLEQPDPDGCPDCAGTGAVIRQNGQIPVRHICPRCGGGGHPPARACTVCAATGTLSGTRPVKVRVPAGVSDGARLRIRRKDGPIEAVVRVDADPRFGRAGPDDLTVRVPVTPAEAALGAEVPVPMPDGSAVTVRIPSGTQPGRRLRVSGRGIHRPDRTGDLIVTVDVVVPAVLSDAQRAAYEALAAVSENPRDFI